MEQEDTEKETNPHFEEARKHMRAARSAMRKSYEEMFPPEVRENHRAVRREFLLAIRSMVDAALERTEKRSKTD